MFETTFLMAIKRFFEACENITVDLSVNVVNKRTSSNKFLKKMFNKSK